MAGGEVVIEVERTPEEVWKVIADVERAPEWVPDMISARKLTEGEIGVGTRYHEVISMQGKESEAELEITRYEPHRVFAHEGEGGPAKFSATFTLEPTDSGQSTKLTHSWTLKMSGIMRMMEPMIRGLVQKNSEAATDNLKRLLEDGELS